MNINLIYYEGQNINNYYVTDYNNDFNLLLKKLWKIFVLEKYKDYKVYFHNFSKFDGINILSLPSKVGNKSPDEESLKLNAHFSYDEYYQKSIKMEPSRED